MKTSEKTVKKFDGLILKIQANATYPPLFSTHLGRSIVAVGTRLNTDRKKEFSFSEHAEMYFIENTSKEKNFYYGKLHDLVCLKNSEIPDYYREVAANYYNLDEMNTLYVVRDLVKISESEFKAILGKYFLYGWVDENYQPKKFNIDEFMQERTNRRYIRKSIS